VTGELSIKSGAVRTREWRRRKSDGARILRITIFDDDVDGLLQLGQIAEDEAYDNRALATAAADFLTFAIRDALKSQHARDASHAAEKSVPLSPSEGTRTNR
jgi:hypothetical protein